MKILHLYKHATPDSHGGIENVIDNLATGAAMAGHSVKVLAHSKNGGSQDLEYNGYSLHYCKKTVELFSTPFSYEFFRTFKNAYDWADIINAHYPYPFAECVQLLSLKKKPTIATYHSDIVRQKHIFKFYKPLADRFLRKVDCIVATSPNYIASSEALQRFKHKAVCIQLGTKDLAANHNSVKRDKKSRPYFLFLGMFRYYKGLEYLLRAADSVDADIVIAGQGREESKIREYIRERNLKNVKVFSNVDEIQKVELLANCYGFVLPSYLRSEAFGVVLLEASVFAKPLISCEISAGNSYVNCNGETGIVVRPKSASDLGAAMNKLLADPKMALQMGQNARLRYEKLFTSKAMVDKYLRLYSDVFARVKETHI